MLIICNVRKHKGGRQKKAPYRRRESRTREDFGLVAANDVALSAGVGGCQHAVACPPVFDWLEPGAFGLTRFSFSAVVHGLHASLARRLRASGRARRMASWF